MGEKRGLTSGVCWAYKAAMRRSNYYLPEPMLARLKELSRQTGVSVSEIIRRAIDAYLNAIARDKQ